GAGPLHGLTERDDDDERIAAGAGIANEAAPDRERADAGAGTDGGVVGQLAGAAGVAAGDDGAADEDAADAIRGHDGCGGVGGGPPPADAPADAIVTDHHRADAAGTNRTAEVIRSADQRAADGYARDLDLCHDSAGKAPRSALDVVADLHRTRLAVERDL